MLKVLVLMRLTIWVMAFPQGILNKWSGCSPNSSKKMPDMRQL